MNTKKAGSLYFTLIAISVGATLLLSLLQNRLAGYADLLNTPAGMAGALLLPELLILIPMLVWALRTPAPVQEMFGFHLVHVRTLLLSLLLLLVSFPVVMVLNLFSQLWTGNVVEELSGQLVSLPAWESLLLIGIAGPCMEELVFRGYLFRSLRSSGRTAAAVILSGVLFGLMHLNFNQACYAVFLGIVLAAAVEMSGSIVTSLVMHMVFNSVEVGLMYALPSAADFSDPALEGGMTIDEYRNILRSIPGVTIQGIMAAAAVLLVFLIVLCLILAVLILNAIARIEGRPEMMNVRRNRVYGCMDAAQGETRRGKLLSFWMILGILLAAVFIALTDFIL